MCALLRRVTSTSRGFFYEHSIYAPRWAISYGEFCEIFTGSDHMDQVFPYLFWKYGLHMKQLNKHIKTYIIMSVKLLSIFFSQNLKSWFVSAL